MRPSPEDEAPHPLATPVTVSVRRPDAPDWRGPIVTVTCPRNGGGRSASIEVGPLGAGEYELHLSGFSIADGSTTAFRIPEDRELTLRGAPQ